MAPPDAGSVLDAFAAPGIERLPVPAGPLHRLVEATADAAQRWGADVVVVDSYGLGAVQESTLARRAPRVAVIDDLADRPHDCDLLIDATLGRRPDAYGRLTPARAQILTGPAYALLRPAYAAGGAVLKQRRPEPPPRRVLISMGLTDLRGITGRVLHLVRPALGEMEADIALGSGASSLPWLRHLAGQDRRLRLHVDTPAMAELMAEADIGVGAGGSSVWERAALGLPSLCLILADNQEDMAWELDRRGVALAVETRGADFADAFSAALARLLEDAALRAQISRTSAELCDGMGAARAAQAILGLVG